MVNWVVVGVGDITTRRVIPAIAAEPRSSLYSIVSRTPEKALRYTARVWTELRDAVADPAVDAVYVASPVFLHCPQTIEALRSGKHVLCEKPVALNYTDAVAMNDASAEAGKLFGAAYYRRLYPKVQRARELLRLGVVGRPVLAEANCHSDLSGIDNARAWLLDPAMAGGGPLFDIASHRIDVLHYWFGKPLRVAAQLSNAVHSLAVEDNATVLIEFESGVRGIVDVRWHSRIFRDQCRVIGTEGEINLSPLSGPELVYPGGSEHLPTHQNLHFPLIENFVAAVLDGAPLAANGAEAILTDWVTDQAITSASG